MTVTGSIVAIVSAIVIGLIIGALSRLVLPDKQNISICSRS
jgi:hypothetical protein